ncbi:unnamed protein product [Durusdinium trenchii]|uniref:Uncharacterized protein n=1 Tax=Durusdinium trenchii TaxID=1381693 RepID=A0ABP0LK69_9DINO
MTIPKQKLFMDRVLFVFEITKAKAGKAQVLRLSSQQWMAEADVACLAGDILERMESHRNSDNILLFPPDTLKMVKQRFVEGDFHDELKALVECQHPHFRPADTDMWADHMQNPSSAGKNSLEAADGQIDKLEMDKNKAHFEADALSLARDAAQCAALFQKTQQTERSRRLAKVMHLKQENTVGASIVASYMEKSCKHIGGDRLLPAVDQFISNLKRDKGCLIIWVDYMKHGRLSVADLNSTTELLQKALRVEDKLDARMMVAEPIHIRCAVPPTSKKVALAFPAWLVFQHGTVDSNIFAKSLLLQDKSNRELLPWVPESQYEVPQSRESLPHASEGQRALSTVQETAQLLTGPSLPETMLEALFSNAEVGEVVGLINLSPYDAWVEKTCLQYHIQKGGRKLRSLTCATDVDLVDYSQKLCAMLLMEVDLQKFTFKLASVEEDGSKRGWDRYKISLSNEVRKRHLEDPIHSEQWKNLLVDFDRKLLVWSSSFGALCSFDK